MSSEAITIYIWSEQTVHAGDMAEITPNEYATAPDDYDKITGTREELEALAAKYSKGNTVYELKASQSIRDSLVS
ncbi:hypothetical protein SH668x_003035 [Planctomicrobium sp. SH668]|uniref:hypothetical protein n=1 Tax=Planctomicrobium sp. SH668 TaxID=3448126 RepID=UPI003F5C4053